MSSALRVGPASIEAVKYKQVVAAEDGCVGLDEAVGQVGALGRWRNCRADLGEIVLTDDGVGDPLAVGRERRLERAAALAGVDQGDGVVFEVHGVQVQVIVLEHDAPLVGRPTATR